MFHTAELYLGRKLWLDDEQRLAYDNSIWCVINTWTWVLGCQIIVDFLNWDSGLAFDT